MARRRSKRQKSSGPSGKEHHWKYAGFDAFNVRQLRSYLCHPSTGHSDVQQTQHIISHVPGRKKKKKKVSWVQCEEAVVPETGIHVSPFSRSASYFSDFTQSFGWAQAIPPQTGGFLKLPYEVRLKIYGLVIAEFKSGIIEPLKRGNIFYSPDWPTATEGLCQLCHFCCILKYLNGTLTLQ